jgi:IS30 family transposase
MAQHLNMEEREVISQMRYAGSRQAAIARRLGRCRSTISRELRRNSAESGYLAVTAQRLADQRRAERPLTRKMERPEIDEAVRDGLAHCWSPDQIAGRLKREHPREAERWVSHQTIYDWIKRDSFRAHWESFLRFGGRRRLRGDRRGKIPHAVEIDRRPPIVDRRGRYGDWEGDTMVGARRRGALVTHVERKSGYLLAAKLADRLSETVTRVSRRLFAAIPAPLRRTLTLDNGKEFAGHQRLARATGLAVYFAKPYAAWQRGTNENTNGLVRQFFPKGTDLTRISHQQLRDAVELLNNRPRKRLKYRTPNEVFGPRLDVAFGN